MDYTDLRNFVDSGADAPDNAYIEDCWNTAVVLVDNFINGGDVPSAVVDRCYLMCGSELFHAKNAPNGIAQFNTLDGTPVRIARDPLTPVYGLLSNWIVMGL